MHLRKIFLFNCMYIQLIEYYLVHDYLIKLKFLLIKGVIHSNGYSKKKESFLHNYILIVL